MQQREQALIQELRAAALPVQPAEPLAGHTTFRIGGPAALFCRPRSVAELVKTLLLCRRHGVRVYLLGNGSNTLFADAGFDGAVVSTTALSTPLTVTPVPEGVRVTAGAGMQLAALCQAVQQHSLSGLEFAYGIPGTVGGAVYMNAGAYGGEMRSVLYAVTYLDEDLRLQTRPVSGLALGYRTSVFAQRPWIVLEAQLTLQPGDAEEILARMQDYMRRRREKQPLELPSAGSTFKRPPGAYAGRLIESCGLRGFAVGGAAVSEKHCGFVVNTGGATCADVVELTDRVRDIVQQRTGHRLELEIRVVE